MMRKLVEQNIYALIPSIMLLASGLITSLVLTRLIPVFEFGVYSTLVAFTLLFSGISDLGISYTLLKIVGESFHSNDGHAGFYLRYLLKWRLAALVILCSALLLFSSQLAQLFLHNAELAYVMQALAALVIFFSINQFITNLFTSIGRFEYPSLISISLNFSRLLFPILLILILGPTLLAVTIGVMLAFLLSALVALVFFILKFKLDIGHAAPNSMRQVNSFLFYSTVFSWATFLSSNIDSLMLNYFSGPHELAFFRVSNSVVLTLVSLLPISSNFLMSFLVRMEAKKEVELQRKLFDRSIKYGLLAAIPLMFLIYLTANRVILFLWPSDYLPAAYSLRILSLFIPFYFIAAISSSLFMSKGGIKQLTAIIFLSYIFTWAAGAYLISSYGLAGTALTFVISSVLQSVVLLQFSLKMLKMRFNFMHIIRPFLVSLIISLFIILLNSAIRNTMVLFITAGALFCILYIPFMDVDDKKLANTILSFVRLGPLFR